MNNFSQFTNQIIEYKKSNQFQQALELFKNEKSNYSNEEISSNRFLISAMIASLRKTNKSGFVNQFLNTYGIVIDERTDPIILSQYGWVIYDLFKAEVEKTHYSKSFVLNLLQNPIRLLSINNSDFTSSIISNIFRLLLRKEKDKQNQDYQFLNEFCNLFDPEIMSIDISTIEQNGKFIEMASEKEMWYATKSKALFELEFYQECFEISAQALEEFHEFHYSNDLWFARRMALSKQSLGKIDEAIVDLEKIFRRKKEWFIQKELAELYLQVKNLDRAYQYAIEAISRNGLGKIEYKIGLIFLLGNILKIQANLTMANKHFWAVKLIREQHGWKIPFELQEQLNEFEPLNISYDVLLSELKKFWIPNKIKENEEVQTGIVKIILHDNEQGKNGFITSDEVDYYFILPSHIGFCKDVSTGSSVKFVEIPQTNGKKRAKIIKVVPL
jgi:hypothetical protein